MLKKKELLKIEILAKGIKITPSAEKELSQNNKKPITLAEYATTSGIPLHIEKDIWVNAPFFENFCKKTDIVLDFDGENYFIIWKNEKYTTHPMQVPDYFDKKNKHGILWVNFGVTHTDRIRISPIRGCFFSCKFCDLNLLLYKKKKIEDLIKIVEIAKNDKILPAKHGIISGGTPKPEDREYFLNTVEKIAKSVDIPMDMFIAPWLSLDYIEKFYSFGINNIFIDLEIWNKKIAKKMMPEKAAIGREYYLKFIKKAVDVFGKKRVSSLLLVGLEPIEETLEGVENLAKIGCIPVLSPFRPSPKTCLSKFPPPTSEQMIEVYEKSKKIVAKYNIKLGPRCIPCQHNTLTFPDGSDFYYYS